MQNQSPSSALSIEPAVLTPELAAAYLCRKPKTLKNWRLAGAGPRYVRMGKDVFYRRVDLDDFVVASVCDPGPTTWPVRPEPASAAPPPKRGRGRPRKEKEVAA